MPWRRLLAVLLFLFVKCCALCGVAGAGHALEDFFSESDEDNTAEGKALERAEEERQRIAMFRKASVDTDGSGSDGDAPAGTSLSAPWVVRMRHSLCKVEHGSLGLSCVWFM